ncbi:MAG: YitT family protein [Methanobrevibacter sp.]|uniref:YczE/YyaS/YitT family protein n=1 Tax=Methanobrevibacter sp. TaxID=66852 RepID=UPI003F10552A
MMNFFNQNKIEYKRIIKYVVGLFIMNIGIAFSIKSNLGSTPVVAVPYTISIISGIDVGICNMAFLCFVVLIELLLLRKAFHPKHFLQVFVGILFGAFTSISMILLSVIPPIDNLIIQIIFLILGIVILAFGLFLYVPTNVVPVPIDGLTQAVSIYANQSFAKIKVMTDITMIIISLSLSLIFHVSDITVGIGTIIAALSVGTTVKIMNMIYAKLTGKEADLKKM